MIQVIGSFNLGGVTWSIKLDDSPSEYRYRTEIGTHTIIINDRLQDNIRVVDKLYRNLWEAIAYITIVDFLHKRKFNTREYITGFGTILNQVYSTIGTVNYLDAIMEDRPEIGSYSIGGCIIRIIRDNRTCNEDGVDGRIDPSINKVIVRTRNSEGKIFDMSFIKKVIWHEIVHSINHELGYDHGEHNKEPFVNALGNLLFEVHSTLNVNFNGTNTETTSTI